MPSLDALRALTQRYPQYTDLQEGDVPDTYGDSVDFGPGDERQSLDLGSGSRYGGDFGALSGHPGGLGVLGANDRLSPRYMVGDAHGVYSMGDTPQGRDAFDTFGAMRPAYDQGEFDKHQAVDHAHEDLGLAQLMAALRGATQANDPIGNAHLAAQVKGIGSAEDVSLFNDPGVAGMRQSLSDQKIRETTAVPIIQGQTTLSKEGMDAAIRKYTADVAAGANKEVAMMNLLGHLTGTKTPGLDEFGHNVPMTFDAAAQHVGSLGLGGASGTGSGQPVETGAGGVISEIGLQQLMAAQHLTHEQAVAHAQKMGYTIK